MFINVLSVCYCDTFACVSQLLWVTSRDFSCSVAKAPLGRPLLICAPFNKTLQQPINDCGQAPPVHKYPLHSQPSRKGSQTMEGYRPGKEYKDFVLGFF